LFTTIHTYDDALDRPRPAWRRRFLCAADGKKLQAARDATDLMSEASAQEARLEKMQAAVR